MKTRMKPKGVKSNGAKLLNLDPSRTGDLRKRFEQEVTRRLNRVKSRIIQDVVLKDAFGRGPTFNYDPSQPRLADGRWGGTGFHGTHPREAAGIKEKGFDVRSGRTSYYGAGAYFFIDQEKGHKHATGYGTEVITAKLHITNPYVQEEHMGFEDKGHMPFLAGPKSPFRPELERRRNDGDGRSYGHILTDVLKEKGYDGVITWEDGKKIAVVFDVTGITMNVFCPTGEGGGIDATCSPGGHSLRVKDLLERAAAIKHTDDDITDKDGFITRKGVWGSFVSSGEKEYQYGFDTPGGQTFTATYNKQGSLPGEGKRKVMEFSFADSTGTTSITGQGGKDALSVFRQATAAAISVVNHDKTPAIYFTAAEPSRVKLYDTMVAMMGAAIPGYVALSQERRTGGKRYLFIKKELEEHGHEYLEKMNKPYMLTRNAEDDEPIKVIPPRYDPEWDTEEYWADKPTANADWSGLPQNDQVKAFEDYLLGVFADEMTGKAASSVWEMFIMQALARGAKRSFDEYIGKKQAGSLKPDMWKMGARDQFLQTAFTQPIAKEKIQLLVSRPLRELKGMTDATANTLLRTLADGLAQGRGPRQIGREIAKVIDDMSVKRATTIARTEIIRAHAEGQLIALKQLGVQEVGAMVEWSTVKDGKVCAKCKPLQGIVLKIDEATGLLPRHPNAVFEGSTFISYGETLELVRAHYRGPSVILLTSWGKRTTIGPNHPMLTSRGLVKAADIKEGDQILYDLRHDNPDGSTVDLKQVPTVEDVFETFVTVGKNPKIPSPGSDFHGDVVFCHGEIEAVVPMRGLLKVLDSGRIEELREHNLLGSDSNSKAVSGSSPGLHSSFSVLLPPTGSMSCTDDWVAADLHYVWLTVEKIEHGEFTGLAFDFTTKSSLYCNNGFVVSNCRCAWTPANVGEKPDGQKRSKPAIMGAIAMSKSNSSKKDKWGETVAITKERPPVLQLNVDTHGNPKDVVSAWMLLNAFCPTGKGGGIDPSCGGIKLPPPPTFVSSNKAAVAENNKAIGEMRFHAAKGDAAAVAAHPGTPSPKVQQHKQDLLAAIAKGTGTKTTTAHNPSPPTPPSPQEVPVAKGGSIGAVKDHVVKATGYTHEQLKSGLSGVANPGNKEAAVLRAKVTGAIYEGGHGIKDAALQVIKGDNPGIKADVIKGITTGNPTRALKEFADTPIYDLHVLTGITQSPGPVQGQAVCYMASRVIEMGSTSVTGDYRHELGHAIRSALGGESHAGQTVITKAIHDDYAKVQSKVKADPSGLKMKLSHDEYETKYGVVGRRSLDNWEEHFAEHYRLYHREIYRDTKEGGNGKYLAQYRERHPTWANIWDAHYTAALIGQQGGE